MQPTIGLSSGVPNGGVGEGIEGAEGVCSPIEGATVSKGQTPWSSQGLDSGDKATNKAMSVAFKYACFQTFCIPTENLIDDPDADTPELNRKNSGNKQSKDLDNLRNELSNELVRIGYTWSSVIKKYKVDSVEHLTSLQLKDCLKKIKSVEDKAVS